MTLKTEFPYIISVFFIHLSNNKTPYGKQRKTQELERHE
jgi:hypothetical protein